MQVVAEANGLSEARLQLEPANYTAVILDSSCFFFLSAALTVVPVAAIHITD